MNNNDKSNDKSAAKFPEQYIGNYRLLRLLGRGGFASVYLGEHRYLKRLAAIKVLRTVLNDQDRESFYKEARLLANLSHPHIVRVLEFAVAQRTNYEGSRKYIEYVPYLVMDFASGSSLRTLYPAGSCLFPDVVLNYIKQIASALQYAHDKGVIHRDVKPENCLLNEQQEVMLSDFGLALLAPSPELLSTQMMAGTLPYAAPEQLRGKPEFASDQYSLGVMSYEWLCGHRPFDGEAVEVILQHMSSSPPSLRGWNPGISQAMEEVVMRALEKDPQHRYPSVQEFADALEHAYRKSKKQDVYASQAQHGQAVWLINAQNQRQGTWLLPPEEGRTGGLRPQRQQPETRPLPPERGRTDGLRPQRQLPETRPSPPKQKKKGMLLIIGTIVFMLLLGSSSTFYLRMLGSSSAHPGMVLPSLPGTADFTVKPASVRGMVLVANQADFQGDHSELGASQSVVADFSLPESGKLRQVSIFINALIGRSGNNDGYAPIDLYCNDRIFVKNFTFPGDGFQSNEVSFQIPLGQLVNGKNEIKLIISSRAESEFWLYNMGISTALPSAPAVANFATNPVSIQGMTLVQNEVSFEGNRSALGADQQVVIAFDLPGSSTSGKPKLASVVINALVARSGTNHGSAPIDLYCNGQNFVKNFTFPGEGLQPNATSFQLPPEQLVYGKNEIKLLVANTARSEFWLYSMGIKTSLPY